MENVFYTRKGVKREKKSAYRDKLYYDTIEKLVSLI